MSLKRNHYAMCVLCNGAVAPYDAACKPGRGECYSALAFQYLGRGFIDSIGGRPMGSYTLLDFYKLRPDRPRRMR